jgi:hypothetical protein
MYTDTSKDPCFAVDDRKPAGQEAESSWLGTELHTTTRRVPETPKRAQQVILEPQKDTKNAEVSQQTLRKPPQDQNSKNETGSGVSSSFYFDALMTRSSISLLTAPDAPSGTTIRMQGFFEADQESNPSLV